MPKECAFFIFLRHPVLIFFFNLLSKAQLNGYKRIHINAIMFHPSRGPRVQTILGKHQTIMLIKLITLIKHVPPEPVYNINVSKCLMKGINNEENNADLTDFTYPQKLIL